MQNTAFSACYLSKMSEKPKSLEIKRYVVKFVTEILFMHRKCFEFGFIMQENAKHSEIKLKFILHNCG